MFGFTLFDTSILEVLIKPLGKIKIVADYWAGVVRSPANYEHAYGPLVICALFLRWIPIEWLKWSLYGVLVFVHVVAKELIHDRIRSGHFHWPNVIERVYGCALAVVALL